MCAAACTPRCQPCTILNRLRKRNPNKKNILNGANKRSQSPSLMSMSTSTATMMGCDLYVVKLCSTSININNSGNHNNTINGGGGGGGELIIASSSSKALTLNRDNNNNSRRRKKKNPSASVAATIGNKDQPSITTARSSSATLACSRPCLNCVIAMYHSGIVRRVIYSIDSSGNNNNNSNNSGRGYYEVVKVRDLWNAIQQSLKLQPPPAATTTSPTPVSNTNNTNNKKKKIKQNNNNNNSSSSSSAANNNSNNNENEHAVSLVYVTKSERMLRRLSYL